MSETLRSDTVTREDADGVATLTLQKPGLTSALRLDLLAAVREVAADDAVRAVLLTGTVAPSAWARTSPSTSSRCAATPRRPSAWSRRSTTRSCWRSRAAGAARRRDQRRRGRRGAGHRPRRGPAGGRGRREVHHGLHRHRAVQRLGAGRPARALRRRLAGDGAAAAARAFLAETALEWGMVHRVVPAEQVRDEAQALAVRLATGPTAAYRAVKTVLATAATDPSRRPSPWRRGCRPSWADRRPPGGRRGLPRQATGGVHRQLETVPPGAGSFLGAPAAGRVSPPGGRASGARQRARVAQAGQTSRAATGHASSVRDPRQRAAQRQLARPVDLGGRAVHLHGVPEGGRRPDRAAARRDVDGGADEGARSGHGSVVGSRGHRGDGPASASHPEG